ncbi:hypothetical protein [Inmirania thermothiophila]|uniref:DUF7931 domain-containing protein n=1 Tax=Inmirania thermothiophila TaxID=1750597 RepID=A0A3N1Y1A1_9GAMM|nr:hypothetical protein [Inmirania thermothiophila]ROR32298.1 hypothetical protein EDC57_1496 [Inmirania thermothiophila]
MSEAAAQPAAIAAGRLGETRGPIAVTTLEAHRLAVLRLAAQARRELAIFSPALDPRVFDHEGLAEAVRALLLRSPRARVRVVVQDAAPVAARGHRLLRLAWRLPSRMEIRRAGPDHQGLDEAFVLADETGVLETEHAERYEAVLDFCNPPRARALRLRFEEIWAQAERDPNLLRLDL